MKAKRLTFLSIAALGSASIAAMAAVGGGFLRIPASSVKGDGDERSLTMCTGDTGSMPSYTQGSESTSGSTTTTPFSIDATESRSAIDVTWERTGDVTSQDYAVLDDDSLFSTNMNAGASVKMTIGLNLVHYVYFYYYTGNLGGTLNFYFADASGNSVQSETETGQSSGSITIERTTSKNAYNFVFEYTPISGQAGYCKIYNLTFKWYC